jgi:CheY-like chemotaxis protein
VAARREQIVRVLVVDDDPDFVEAAKLSLAADRRIEVVGGATSGEEAVKQAAALRPEVVAMDVVMPGLDGLEATRLIRKDQPECRVVLVSGSIFVDRGDEGDEAARAAGASAYVVKSRAVLDLAELSPSLAAPGTRPGLRHDPTVGPGRDSDRDRARGGCQRPPLRLRFRLPDKSDPTIRRNRPSSALTRSDLPLSLAGGWERGRA